MAGRDSEGTPGEAWPSTDFDHHPDHHPDRHPRQRPESAELPTAYLDQPTRQFPAVTDRSAAEDRTEPFARPVNPSQGQVPPAPKRATPVRIEPQDEAMAVRTRRKRGPLIAVVVLLVLGLAVVLALPDVSNRLALPWAPNAPAAPEPEPLSVSRRLPGPAGTAPAPSASGVAAALRTVSANPALGRLSGSVVDPANGTVLWQQDPNRPLPPASTTKILTAAAALLMLDPSMRMSTKVVAGDAPGSVVLVGGGDPTLSSLPTGKDSVYPGAAHLDDLVAQVREATGGNVDTVSVDLGVFRGEDRGPGWSPEDVPSTYAARAVPAMLDGGRTDPTQGDSPRVGDPAGTLAAELAERLGARVTDGVTAAAPSGAQVLGEVHSAPLTELVDIMLTDSDNVLAEAVSRQTAIAIGKEPSFAGASAATEEVLRRNGFDLADVDLSDGSGLSDDNRIPARLLTDLLVAAAAPDESDPRTAKLRPLLGGLPVAGGNGTLAERFGIAATSDGRGWVRAKTGTLSEVNTLAGVVLDADGRVLVFALMSSGSSADKARPALDAITAELRACGCR